MGWPIVKINQTCQEAVALQASNFIADSREGARKLCQAAGSTLGYRCQWATPLRKPKPCGLRSGKCLGLPIVKINHTCQEAVALQANNFIADNRKARAGSAKQLAPP